MPWANAAMVLNSRDLTGGQYNNSQFNAIGQNIVQGQIHSVSLNEINFPYDIPNVQGVTSGFDIYDATAPAPAPRIPIVLPAGFYNGVELEAAINLELGASGAAAVTCHYDLISNRFDFTTNAGPWILESSYTFPAGYTLTQQRGQLGKDMLSMMGYAFPGSTPLISQNAPFLPGSGSGSAPMVFTQYVDVCSPQLCKFQDFNTGSTTNFSRKSDLLSRLYISNNIAVLEFEGARPFVINRQYINARVMKWTTGSSVGTIDITLYDDVGQPLATEWAPRPYQITFNCYEMDNDDKEVYDSSTGNAVTLPRHSAYQAKNLAAWNSGSFPMSR